jgi:hypothetical protein
VRDLHDEKYIYGFLGDTDWEVWIYQDQAQLTGPKEENWAVILEHWDARTPQDLIDRLVLHIKGVL